MKIIKNALLLNEYVSSAPYTDYFCENLIPYTQIVDYEAGEYIFRQEELPKYLYLMLWGRCSVRMLLANGKSIILHTMEAPCLIGEMELIREVPTFTVQTLEKSRMLAIPWNECKSFLMNDPYFLRRVCFDLIGKERLNAASLIHAFGYPLENRLAKFILDNRQENQFFIKKVHIAESLGVSYRHVEKVMSDFVKKNYLSKAKLVYTIVDERSLSELAKELYITAIE